MKKKLILAIVAVLFALTANAQKALKKVYNENINPIEQIDQAVGGWQLVSLVPEVR